jgi:pimeloyl-ACP methyl ester carboxylesterase
MRLNHERHGSGEPLVILHGIGHHHGGWRPVAARLAHHHEVFAVDLPGFGRTPMLRDAEPTVVNLAGAVRAFMQGQGRARFHVAGNSLGGGIALELARGDDVLSTTAISPIGFCGRPGEAWLNAMLVNAPALARAAIPLVERTIGIGAVRRAITRLLGEAHGDRVPPDALLQTIYELAYAPGFEATRRATMHAPFRDGPELRGPVTVAWGEDDILLWFAAQSARARAALPQAKHVGLPGCGHVPVYDDPDQVAGVILDAAARQE